MTNSTKFLASTKPIAKVEPRLALALTLAYSLLVWEIPASWLLWYALLLYSLWWKTGCWYNIPTRTFRRTIFFCLLWAGLAFSAQSFSLLWNYFVAPGEQTLITQQFIDQSFINKSATTQQAIKQSFGNIPQHIFGFFINNTILFCRLFLLLCFSLWLTTFVSARALALAFTWFTKPFLRSKTWQVSLALALMLKFLPLIHQTLAHMQTSAQARHLPHSGYPYWKNALPQFFRLLHGSTYAQALAITSRHLDTCEAWDFLPTPDYTSITLCLLLTLGIIIPFLYNI